MSLVGSVSGSFSSSGKPFLNGSLLAAKFFRPASFGENRPTESNRITFCLHPTNRTHGMVLLCVANDAHRANHFRSNRAKLMRS